METLTKDRDSTTGRFLPGHKPHIVTRNSGNNGGRKPTMRTEVKNALEYAKDAMPEIISGMIERALDGDQKAAEYLTDRIYGKANQPMTGDFQLNNWLDLVKDAQKRKQEREINY